MCGGAGRDAGTSVSICGEDAADPHLAPVLFGMGITSLSMSAASVPAVRAALASRAPTPSAWTSQGSPWRRSTLLQPVLLWPSAARG